MNTLIRSMLLTSAFLFAQSGFAAQLYFDGGLGNADVDIGGFGGSDTYLRLGVGGEISNNLNWEAGYWDLGEASDSGATASADGLFGNVKFSHDLNSDTSIFGKLGLFMWDGSTNCCGSDDGNDLFYGGGVTFKKVGPGNINLEILMTELGADLGDFEVTTIGGSYSIPFGK